MAIQTFPYRVRGGHVLAHEGRLYDAGETVDLVRRVAVEVRHKVEPVNDAGEVIPEPTALELELEARPEHEHVSILRRRRAEALAHLVDLQDIAARTAATATAAAQEVTRLQAEIGALDRALETPAAAPLVEPAPATPADEE